MSLKTDIRKKVEYQCNKCAKLRILFIAPALQGENVDSHGYTEFADVHICKDDELQAIKLFVDAHYDVRSQVTVESKTSSEEPSFTELDGLNIPVPKKAEFIDVTIEPTIDFGGYNLKQMEIKDKLRSRDFLIKGTDQGKEISQSSPLGFINITIQISDDVDDEHADEWLLSLANTMESLVYLDESLLKYLGIYLDHMLPSPPKAKELLEMSILLHSTIAIPHSTTEHIKIFEDHVKELFPELNVLSYRMYKSIMETCLLNEDKTLMEVYEIVKEKAVQIQAFPFFLSVISQLVSFGFVNLEKLEFYTIC